MTNTFSRRTRGTRGWRVPIALCVAAVLLAVAGCTGNRGADPSAQAAEVEGVTQVQDTSFGDLPSPCGPGDASGATQQGVTDEAITIGFGDDAGYQGAPGLNHEMSDAMEAIIEWCNEQGGINGRRVVGNYYDAMVLEAANATQEACTEVFMLVGQGFALDGGAEPARLNCSLATVPGFTSNSEFAMAPLMVQPNPNPTDFNNVQQAAALARAFPAEVKKAAVVYSSLPSTIDATEKMLGTYTTQGFELSLIHI